MECLCRMAAQMRRFAGDNTITEGSAGSEDPRSDERFRRFWDVLAP